MGEAYLIGGTHEQEGRKLLQRTAEGGRTSRDIDTRSLSHKTEEKRYS